MDPMGYDFFGWIGSTGFLDVTITKVLTDGIVLCKDELGEPRAKLPGKRAGSRYRQVKLPQLEMICYIYIYIYLELK